jgi:hypothetical protein
MGRARGCLEACSETMRPTFWSRNVDIDCELCHPHHISGSHAFQHTRFTAPPYSCISLPQRLYNFLILDRIWEGWASGRCGRRLDLSSHGHDVPQYTYTLFTQFASFFTGNDDEESEKNCCIFMDIEGGVFDWLGLAFVSSLEV